MADISNLSREIGLRGQFESLQHGLNKARSESKKLLRSNTRKRRFSRIMKRRIRPKPYRVRNNGFLDLGYTKSRQRFKLFPKKDASRLLQPQHANDDLILAGLKSLNHTIGKALVPCTKVIKSIHEKGSYQNYSQTIETRVAHLSELRRELRNIHSILHHHKANDIELLELIKSLKINDRSGRDVGQGELLDELSKLDARMESFFEVDEEITKAIDELESLWNKVHPDQSAHSGASSWLAHREAKHGLLERMNDHFTAKDPKASEELGAVVAEVKDDIAIEGVSLLKKYATKYVAELGGKQSGFTKSEAARAKVLAEFCADTDVALYGQTSLSAIENPPSIEDITNYASRLENPVDSKSKVSDEKTLNRITEITTTLGIGTTIASKLKAPKPGGRSVSDDLPNIGQEPDDSFRAETGAMPDFGPKTTLSGGPPSFG